MPNCTIYNSQGDKLAAFSTEPFSSAITIGRSSICTICLKGYVDTAISRVHLVMSKHPMGWKVTNKGRAAMYRQCLKQSSIDLNEGDIIRFANLFLAYGDTAKPAAFDLAWDADTEDGKTRAVLWPGLNSVGASHDNYVMIRTMDISRLHAYFLVNGNHVSIRSATLANSTLVNGEEVGEDEREINTNDSLQLADTPIRLVSTMRYALSEAPVQVAVKKGVFLSNSDSVNNKTLMYVMLAIFTLLVTLIIFLCVRVLV